jgi:hypothetical protein
VAAPRFQVYGLDETYPELGKFGFKVVLNPRFAKSGQDYGVRIVDSDRAPMAFELKKWGRKLNVEFAITPQTSDGVSTVFVERNGAEVGRLSFWVIKP